jgi:hypothetical protein
LLLAKAKGATATASKDTGHKTATARIATSFIKKITIYF